MLPADLCSPLSPAMGMDSVLSRVDRRASDRSVDETHFLGLESPGLVLRSWEPGQRTRASTFEGLGPRLWVTEAKRPSHRSRPNFWAVEYIKGVRNQSQQPAREKERRRRKSFSYEETRLSTDTSLPKFTRNEPHVPDNVILAEGDMHLTLRGVGGDGYSIDSSGFKYSC